MSPEALLAHLHAAMRAKPPEGVSVAYLDGFFTRNRAALLALLAELLPSRSPGVPTRWGGARGETPLTAAEITLGRRVVDRAGRHGKVARVLMRPGFSGGPPYADGDITLDSGLTERIPVHLYAELAPPVHVPRDPSFLGEVMSPDALWRIVTSALETALTSESLLDGAKPGILRYHQTALREQLVRFAQAHEVWLQWRAEHPDEPVDGYTGLAARRAELERKFRREEASPTEIAERAALRTLSNVWTTLRVGEGVARVRVGPRGKTLEPGWRLVGLDGEQAEVQLGDLVETTPSWLLQPAPLPAESITLPTEPTYLCDLSALLSRNTDHYAAMPPRAAISRAVKGYLAEHGLRVSTSVERGSGITSIQLSPAVGLSWEPGDKDKLHRLLPGLNVWDSHAYIEPWERKRAEYDPYADYGGKWGGVALPVDQLLRFARHLVPQLVREDITLSPLGEAIRLSLRPASAAASPSPIPSPSAPPREAPEGCVEVSFTLAGHGLIRVVCGAQGRRDQWNNVHVGKIRYGYNGGRWARGQRPPEPVLDAVRARGITAFDGP
ncbi:MAG: hypothetical protein IPO67_25555 [Deltaproteobacteria bacterium]|nr:hypothetical protein [Deltaproteobacteria bacterium]